MKIIAFYLPQYHEIPENNKWWGKGFTEWTNLKKARPLFNGHNQPRIPFNKNYYNLLDTRTLEWQSNIALSNGIYGFCYYHYWFEGKLLLEKPAELMLQDKNIKIKFCFSWANETWTKAWADKKDNILIKQTYGDKVDWIRHFNYLLKFFKDDRYIKINGNPLFIIYRPEQIECLKEMLDTWNELAKENGFNGITYVYQQRDYDHTKSENGNLFSYGIEYQPRYAMDQYYKYYKFSKKRLFRYITKKELGNPYFSVDMDFEYDKLWHYILKQKPKDDKMIPGAFVDWDNTPRRQYRGTMCTGVTVEKFKKYFLQQLYHAKNIYKKDMIFIFAWNEWGESGYLEPDEENKDGMLKAIKDDLKEFNEGSNNVD